MTRSSRSRSRRITAVSRQGTNGADVSATPAAASLVGAGVTPTPMNATLQHASPGRSQINLPNYARRNVETNGLSLVAAAFESVALPAAIHDRPSYDNTQSPSLTNNPNEKKQSKKN